MDGEDRPGSQSSLVTGFFDSVERFPARPALLVGNERWTYRALRREAVRIASSIARYEEAPSPLAALFASRSPTAYAGVLGILTAGKGYVPLNPTFPLERTRRMLLHSGCSTLIVGLEGVLQLPGLLLSMSRPLTVILPDVGEISELAAALPQHRFVTSGQMPNGVNFGVPATDPDATAALLFTSGSTGEPKAVPLSHASIQAYVRYVGDRYAVSEGDRLSQEAELTSDLSLHDLFLGWERGACVCVVPEQSRMVPGKFIRAQELTLWLSPPSVIGVLAKTGLLPSGSFPSLRYSLFCREPLSAAYARLWQEAAPHSIVENLYGPTEATIAISHYRWNSATSPDECVNGMAPIGRIFGGQEACVVDEQQAPVPDGQRGELCLAGSQVTHGYWNDPDKTSQHFVRLPDQGDTVWFRTGDLVKRGADGCLHYLGRADHEVKIRGHRVELAEIEAVLSRICRTEHVVVVPFPVTAGSADGVVAFVAGAEMLDPRAVVSACREVLPEYMVPRQVLLLPEMPRNASGRINRTELMKMLGGW